MIEECEAEVVAEIALPPMRTTLVRQSTAQLGSQKNFHVTCPCCSLVFQVDHDDAIKSMEEKAGGKSVNFTQYVRNRIQNFFTNAWGWKTHFRGGQTDCKGGRRHAVRSDVIDTIQSGVGYSLRRAWVKREEAGLKKPWFAVLWHQAPTVTRQFFACEIGMLFDVLKGIADDSPAFAERLASIGRTALKRDGSSSSEP